MDGQGCRAVRALLKLCLDNFASRRVTDSSSKSSPPRLVNHIVDSPATIAFALAGLMNASLEVY
jgi:hypothetical protein